MFKISMTPRFGDIDGLRHVNNNVLGVWFETGRNDIFRFFTPNLSLDYEDWKLILVRTEYDYLGQMFFDGDVEIRTYITKIGNSSFTIGHEAWQDNELKAKGLAVLVHFDFIEQKSVPIPDDIRTKLEEHLIDEADIGKL
ncbi:MAG: thioesterase family protein [Methanobrevibacter sp.]|uniref:acyl-CoA thioesterase n=1 Tax=Methanobrevibacter sp. TaxID=66852 RepID=UPI0026E0B8E5|nr:thioesterase family protein [Methanobrevibacter sp.]MDO5849208.1 thioesterase family protein [Methanobrevibacter sp.]